MCHPDVHMNINVNLYIYVACFIRSAAVDILYSAQAEGKSARGDVVAGRCVYVTQLPWSGLPGTFDSQL
jgi:hypothetical protein